MSRRFELTFPEPLWDRVEEARGHESRASFVKRAVEAALSGDAKVVVPPERKMPVASGASAPSPAGPPRVSDDVRRREPDPRMFKTAGDHRRAMARFNARGEW